MNRQFRVDARLVFIALCIFFATVVASAEQNNAAESTQSAAEIAAMVEAKLLITRIEGRWNALTDADFKSAYEFETPAYRTVYSWKQFRSGFGASVGWRGARVRKIEMHEDLQASPVAEVLVRVRYVAITTFEDKYESERMLAENWIKIEEQWFHLQK